MEHIFAEHVLALNAGPLLSVGYLSAFALAALVCVGAAWRARSVPDPDTRHGLVALFLTSGAWSTAYVGFLLVSSAVAKSFFYQASLIVGFSAVWAWLWFCSAYTGRTLHRATAAQRLAVVVFSAVVLLKLTNPLHGLYYSLEPSGGAFGLLVRHGILYWVVMAVSYALSGAGYLMLFERFVKTDLRAGPLALLTGLTATPAIMNIVGHASPVLRDITHEPLGVAVFAVGVLIVYETQFSKVRAAGDLSNPNLTIGPSGRIRDFGGGAAEAIPGLDEDMVGSPLRKAAPGFAKALQDETPVWTVTPESEASEAEASETGTLETEIRGESPRHYQILETGLGGAAEGQIIVLSDITEQRNREEALRAAKEEAEEAARLKSAMLANMSHEVRTPLTSIIGFAEAIWESDEAASRFARLIEKSGKRLLKTLDGVLNLSKLEAGQMEFDEETVSLKEEAETLAEELLPQAEEAGIDCRVEANGRPACARADKRGVQIALRNLMSNAIKYTEEGEVVVRAYQDEETAVLEVEDTGIGMDPERAEDLFDPFRQASEGLGREYEGTGVGLAVTKEAVDQMGGSIEVETEKDEGTCFTVRFPQAEEASRGIESAGSQEN